MTMYQWAPERSEIHHLTSQNDLQLSPFQVPVCNSRSCDALAFCNVDPNYLAVGLDKVRGDSSFIIWDIQSATPSLPLSKSSTLEKDAIAMPGISSSVSAALRSSYSHNHNHQHRRSTVSRHPQSIGSGITTVWDAQRLLHPLLTFTEKDAAADGARTPRAGASLKKGRARRTRESSKRAFSLASEVVVVNRDGDLELYALHDTPNQASWSARGDLAIGTGLGCKVLQGFQ
ncbi:hypothetical protein M405DRAFT_884797 [Rhizopogon salebrosus TDB-379]|nr:hypothetical protein M405DRAFT_884797 [Rhizopogon salebrosus TDB-379]